MRSFHHKLSCDEVKILMPTRWAANWNNNNTKMYIAIELCVVLLHLHDVRRKWKQKLISNVNNIFMISQQILMKGLFFNKLPTRVRNVVYRKEIWFRISDNEVIFWQNKSGECSGRRRYQFLKLELVEGRYSNKFDLGEGRYSP